MPKQGRIGVDQERCGLVMVEHNYKRPERVKGFSKQMSPRLDLYIIVEAECKGHNPTKNM